MSAFVPTGYVTLAQAVARLAHGRQPELSARVQADEPEWIRLSKKQRFNDAIRASPINVGTFSSRARSSLSPAEAFTEADKTGLTTIELRRAMLAKVRDQDKAVLRQALGDGVLPTYGLTAWGSIVDIPVEPWRTSQGINAMNIGSIKWWTGSPLYQIEAAVLLLCNEFDHWLAGIFPAPAPDRPDEPSDSTATETRSMENPAHTPGSRSGVIRTINTRIDVAQDKATSWMHAAAMKARGQGAYLSRTAGVAQCQLALNCQRDVARKAYTALPKDLKQPRGKPAQRRPAEGKAPTE